MRKSLPRRGDALLSLRRGVKGLLLLRKTKRRKKGRLLLRRMWKLTRTERRKSLL
uniref:Uncharacterized protein n=1 Tax=Brassica oleracea TaxID=3712 RepID=A0A3P6FL52_BRAOL|nr:unnamed protein product [Brassica oleracea]